MKFVFIAKHRMIWPVAWLCDALRGSGFSCLAEPPLPAPGPTATRSLALRLRRASPPATAPMVPAGCGAICSPRERTAVCTGSSG